MVPSNTVIKPKQVSPQAAYYQRKKLGLTGSKEKPVRGWRKAEICNDANEESSIS
jgi:hypothetical protein